MRATVIPDKPINLTQLGAELGAAVSARHDLDGHAVEVAADEVTQQQLEDAIAAHTAVFPPDPDEEFRQAIEGATSVADLKAALLGANGRGPGAEPRRGHPDS